MLAIRQAVKEGSSVQLLQLLANIQSNNEEQFQKEPLVSMAIKLEKWQLVQMLVDYGANINAPERTTGLTALMQCVFSRNDQSKEMLKVLLRRNANVNATSRKGYTALYLAVVLNQRKMAALLLEYGADPNVRAGPEYQRNCCLHQFLLNDDIKFDSTMKMLELLIANKADINAVNGNGQTPLHHAVTRSRNYGPPCNNVVVQFLLKKGASATTHDESNRTPLHMAVSCQCPHPSAIRSLIQHGAIINACDRYKSTPLSLVLSNLYAMTGTDIACLLVKHGAIVQDPKIFTSLFFTSGSDNVPAETFCKVLSAFLQAGLAPHIVRGELVKRYVDPVSEGTAQHLVLSEKDQTAVDSLIEQCQNGLSLQSLCRIAIRQEVIIHTDGSSIIKFIRKMPLPTIILNYLAMED